MSSRLWLAIKFAISCWLLCDMVTDGMTTHSYHQACKIHQSCNNQTLGSFQDTNTQECMIGSCGYFIARQSATLLPFICYQAWVHLSNQLETPYRNKKQAQNLCRSCVSLTKLNKFYSQKNA